MSSLSSQGSSGDAVEPEASLAPPRFDKKLFFLAFASMGIVFGDVGTSPLYAVRECFYGKHAIHADPANIVGVLSLVFWSLAIVVSLKYVTFILRADNHGEGGIFALLGLLPPSGRNGSPLRYGAVLMAGIVGAGLLYGDGVITPAISVLSAIEGLEVATAAAKPFVLPLTCLVLIVLFSLQHRGTAGIGNLFGPVMILWFMSIAALGIFQIVREPRILAAVNPAHAVRFFLNNGIHGFVVLGSVVLCITGCEALYADLGHFGRRAIRLSWLGFVCPALLCNYFGQGALLLMRPDASANPFYGIVPASLLYPMVALSTAATVIASQALISGAFSLTQQAVQLGLFPRLHIVHTSSEMKGQIYIPSVNYALMAACIAVVAGFKESGGLAGAYGIAVTLTMIITSLLYGLVLVRNRRWPLWRVLPLVAAFLFFDIAYFGGNIFKIADGGWFPILIAAVIAAAMATWRRGRQELAAKLIGERFPLDAFLSDLERHPLPRVAGTAVFMTLSPVGTPPALLHHVKHNHVLHEQVVLLSVRFADAPVVPTAERIVLEGLGQGFYRLVASYGFMQKPDVPALLKEASRYGLVTEMMTTTFYMGRETLLTGGQSKMAGWRKAIFAFMSRNAGNPTVYFGIPPNRVVELGTQIQL